MKYFKIEDFKCRCCGEIKMEEEFLKRLDNARIHSSYPFFINSGYRCKAYNDSIGSKESSGHRKGCAVDIDYHHGNMGEILKCLLDEGFTRIGIGESFIHVDSKPGIYYWRY